MVYVSNIILIYEKLFRLVEVSLNIDRLKRGSYEGIGRVEKYKRALLGMLMVTVYFNIDT